MAESGCLRDMAVQNLEVQSLTLGAGGTINGLYASGTITVAAAAADTETGNLTLTQPANTIVKNIYIINQGAADVTVGANAANGGVTLQVGTGAAAAAAIYGPATATATTGNIIDAATTADAQTWLINGASTLVNNMVGSATDAHTHLGADLNSITGALSPAQNAAIFTATSRSLLFTISSISADAAVPISAATWKICVEYLIV